MSRFDEWCEQEGLTDTEEIEIARRAWEAAESQSPWIRVKDQPPKEGQRVVYYFSIVGTHIGYYTQDEYGHDCFYGEHGWLCDDVTHYIPIPELPLEQDEDGEYIYQGDKPVFRFCIMCKGSGEIEIDGLAGECPICGDSPIRGYKVIGKNGE